MKKAMPGKPTPFADAHAHRVEGSACGAIRVLNLAPDWSLDGVPEGALFSAGVHPWDLKGELPSCQLEALERTLLAKGAVAAGECGLDRMAEAPFEIQMEAFAAQARLAESLKLPVIIHCVKAWPEIMSVRNSLKPACPWLAHGFRGGMPLAQELLKHGMKLSFGAKLPNLDLRELPEDSFLLETDDSEIDIESLYEKAAVAMGRPLEALKESLFRNFLSVYGERAVLNERK